MRTEEAEPREVGMEEFRHDQLVFPVTDTGPASGRVVVALHGFPEDRHCWAPLAASLATEGYRVVAFDQRGYAPGARPRPRLAYRMGALVGDVLALVDALGVERVDVLGHDWGAAVAWALAALHPERVRSLQALSVPHPAAFAKALRAGRQALHSWYMGFFQLPWLPETVLGVAGGAGFAAFLRRSVLDEPTARRYAARAADKRAIAGGLAWYRAAPTALRRPLPPVERPTCFVWGDRDWFVTAEAAERCAAHVRGPYRFHRLAGASHWLPTTAADQVAPLLLEHLAAT
ncbi:alpha/beta fold hydrolase [Aciditerrimonas ferrireducens]|uniref:Alpha/beta fold hydrolase n=1 Tax=Aciditerrimonas ferrireducens TaxID=667306 RepID=A0ABV6C5M0_9ACTN